MQQLPKEVIIKKGINVIFAMWNPLYAFVGAYLFGGFDALQIPLQSMGTTIHSSLLSVQPYLLIFIFVLIIKVTLFVKAKHSGVLKELGIPYAREEK